MSKELEVLEEIKAKYQNDNGLLRRLNAIEKSLKALEIIKNKQVDVYWLWLSDDVEKYNDVMDKKFIDIQKYILTQEEYDLLKKILK